MLSALLLQVDSRKLNSQDLNSWIEAKLLRFPQVQFSWSKRRKTKLGDYKYYPSSKEHFITVNNDLQSIAKWVVFLHELAHFQTKVDFEWAKPHGREWQNCFRKLLENEILNKEWEKDELKMLKKFWYKPKTKLTPEERNGFKAGLELQEVGEHPFTINGKGPFRIIKKRRTRYLVEELSTSKHYLIHQDAEVQKHV